MEPLTYNPTPQALIVNSLGPASFLEKSLESMKSITEIIDNTTQQEYTNKADRDERYDLIQAVVRHAFATLLAVPPELASEVYTVPPNIDGLVTVDSPKIIRVTYRHGGFAQAQQINRWRWELTITSSDARGKRLTVKTIVDECDKKRAYAFLAKMATDGLILRDHINQVIPAALEKYDIVNVASVEDIAPQHRGVLGILLASTDEPFSRLFEQLQLDFGNYSGHGKLSQTLLSVSDEFTDFLGVAAPPPDALLAEMPMMLERWQLTQLVLIILHDIWLNMHANQTEAKIEEMNEMVKNGKDTKKVWYYLTGGDKSITKLVNTLSSNRHFIVLDTKSSAYLNVQFNENKFVRGVTDRFNCKAQLVDDGPDYNETLCGKFSTNVNGHGARCNACDRVRKNQAMAEAKEQARIAEEQAAEANLLAVATEKTHPSTSSPDGVYKSGIGTTLPQNPLIPPAKQTPAQEIAENNAKNGPVVIVRSATPERETVTMSPTPPEGINPTDFEGLANYYTDLADQHQKAAHYYADLALRMEEFLREPEEPESVRLAREALEKAVENAAKQREEQFDALKTLLTAGSQQ